MKYLKLYESESDFITQKNVDTVISKHSAILKIIEEAVNKIFPDVEFAYEASNELEQDWHGTKINGWRGIDFIFNEVNANDIFEIDKINDLRELLNKHKLNLYAVANIGEEGGVLFYISAQLTDLI